MRRPVAPVLPLIRDLEAEVVAELAGVDKRTVRRWRAGSSSSIKDEFVADRLAVGLVGHPCLIWPDWNP